MKTHYSGIAVTELDRYLKILITEGTNPEELVTALGNCIFDEHREPSARVAIALEYINDIYKERLRGQLVRAEMIERGECFKKRTGAFVYLRLSESSVAYHKLDASRVYGVCYNGNMASVPKDTLVRRVPITEMLENINDESAWEESVR